MNNKIKQSAAWWCFVPEKMTPQVFVRAVAEIGYSAVELVPFEYWQLVKDHGLVIASANAHSSLTQGLNRRENHASIGNEIVTNLESAIKWGIPNLICFSGSREELDDVHGIANTVDGLSLVARQAEEAGVCLVLEMLNSKVDHPDYHCDHSSWGLEVVKRINSPRVKLLYDVYHMQIMEGDIIRTINEAYPAIGHYHTAGNPGRNDLDDEQEINYPAILKTIAETGYDGYIGHEFVPKGDPSAALRSAFEMTEKAISKII
jgi:hydroxypyruvate isomerase